MIVTSKFDCYTLDLEPNGFINEAEQTRPKPQSFQFEVNLTKTLTCNMLIQTYYPSKPHPIERLLAKKHRG